MGHDNDDYEANDLDGDGTVEGSERDRIQARNSQQAEGAAGRNYKHNKNPADGVYNSYEAFDAAGRNEKENTRDGSQTSFQDNRPDVKFKLVGGGDDGETKVAFKYKQPSVSVKTSANFAEHDVFGDVTVRQKLGEKPDEISVEGICTAKEASLVDDLVYQEVVELVSNRWSGVVHVASTSTDPIAEGGGKDLDTEWIYSFTVECVEITESIDQTETDIEDLLNIEGNATFIDYDDDGQWDLGE